MQDGFVPGQAYLESLYRAKPVAWCCLSCGMPFTLPVDAHSIEDPAVQRFNKVLQKLHERMRDERRCGTDQWDPVACIPLDASIGASVLPDLADEAGWAGANHIKALPSSKNMAADINRILLACDTGGALQDKPGNTSTKAQLDSLLDQPNTPVEVEITITQRHYLCRGCASLCTDLFAAAPAPVVAQWTAKNAQLFLLSSKQNARNLLNNAVLGHCLQIIALSRLRLGSAATESEAYRWKMQALVRLHVGMVLFLCMRVVASKVRQGPADVRRSLHPATESFGLWYTCVFHPLVEWEMKGHQSSTPLRGICGFGSDDTDFACAGLFGGPANPFAEAAVQEVLGRIAALAERYRFVLDPSRAGTRGWGGGSEYYASCGIEESLSLFAGPRIQWVPACMLFGVKGHHLLRRLETSSRGCFESERGARAELVRYIQSTMGAGPLWRA